ncbi:hypothetical protein TNCV_4477951 [Trichonephila clavipes]|nr:hypothetical protein TNCV_4477951 [Trichonephila clavipes]
MRYPFPSLAGCKQELQKCRPNPREREEEMLTPRREQRRRVSERRDTLTPSEGSRRAKGKEDSELSRERWLKGCLLAQITLMEL